MASRADLICTDARSCASKLAADSFRGRQNCTMRIAQYIDFLLYTTLLLGALFEQTLAFQPMISQQSTNVVATYVTVTDKRWGSPQRMSFQDNDDWMEEDTTTQTSASNFDTFKSLQVLTVAVSLFFALVVGLVGDQLFVSAPPVSAQQRALQRVDADELLQSDFNRYDSSVSF